jgi:hypothetical protein
MAKSSASDARPERFGKSVKRFLDEKRDKQRNLEPNFDSIEIGFAIE